MKKIVLIVLAAVLALGVTACGTSADSGNGSGSNLEGDLESILESIYANADLEGYFSEFVEEGLFVQEINADNVEYHLGTSSIEFEKAIASEPVMSTSAYSLCLIRVKEDADIDQVKEDIKNNVDPMKWICVGVDPDNIFVENVGDVIILIMSDEQGDKLLSSFLALGA